MSTVTGPSVQVASGAYLDLLDPDPAVLSIDDIACALSKLCRYTGHCREFYSVAQHSVLCAAHAPADEIWNALMHDAAEAIVNDISRPLKQLLPDYRVVEKRIEKVVFSRFGVTMSPEVKRVDLEALATERRDLMPDTGEAWGVIDGVDPWPEAIDPWLPDKACRTFLIWTRVHGKGREASS